VVRLEEALPWAFSLGLMLQSDGLLLAPAARSDQAGLDFALMH
jgi:hypothetical protein